MLPHSSELLDASNPAASSDNHTLVVSGKLMNIFIAFFCKYIFPQSGFCKSGLIVAAPKAVLNVAFMFSFAFINLLKNMSDTF